MSARDLLFWQTVEVGHLRECWRWLGTTAGDYGVFFVDHERHLAHRYAWSFIYGSIPDGLHVLHACDRPWCVNPRHLRIGTDADNHLDRTVVGRVEAVLAGADAVEPSFPSGFGPALRRLRKERRLTQRALAEIIGVTPGAVCQWERGHSGASVAMVSAVARTLGVDLAALLEVEGD